MGRPLLVFRLAARDLRHNRAEAVLLLVAIAAAATTLTVALALHGVTNSPYATTRTATAGPDVVAAAQTTGPGGRTPSQLTALEHAPGVTASSGPYPLTNPVLVFDGHQDPVFAEGRDTGAARVDQPKLTAGHWDLGGGVVVERSFADLVGLRVGDRISLDTLGGPSGVLPVGRPLEVTGIAVTAALLPSPVNDYAHPSGFPEPGLVWISRSLSQRLSSSGGGTFGYTLNLKLSDPAAAPAFVAAHQSDAVPLIAWQSMATRAGQIISVEQAILLTGSALLGLLALASVAILVGGRMEQQTRRVGLLKAVGATPRLVTSVLLTEQLVLAVVAAAVGLLVGQLAAPLLTDPGARLLGSPGGPSLDLATIGVVFGSAIAVVALATVVPAIRAARTSTVGALADAARRPRRGRWTIALSARLPVPLLLGMRITSRRRRRALLSAASVALTVGALVAVLMFREHAHSIASSGGLYRFSGPGDPLWERGMDVMLVFTVALVLLALINAVLVTWATVQDARHVAAVERALGASPAAATLAVVFAQLLSAVPGAVLGVPVGIGLYLAVGRHSSGMPSVAGMVGAVLLSVLVVAVLTAIPARVGARLPVAEVLQAESC